MSVIRRRPLQTCGNSFAATARRAYARAQELDGPSGSMFKGMARLTILALATPFIHIIKQVILASLYLADTQILAAENMMEKVFPPSSYAFDKIDELVQLAEHLPQKADAIVDTMLLLINKIPFLERILGLVISWINFWIYKFVPVEIENVREKDIPVDASYNEEEHLKSECIGETEDPIESPEKNCGDDDKGEFFAIPESQKPESKRVAMSLSPRTGVDMKTTYKEALEKGCKELKQRGKEERRNAETADKVDHGKTKDEIAVSDDFTTDDPILALFESGWHLNPGKRK